MSRWIKIVTVCLLGFIGLPSWPGLQFAATAAEPADAPIDPVSPPTQITADSMTYDMNKNQANLVGNVVVVDSDMTLKANLVVVTFDKANQPLFIDATGNVVIVRGSQTATSGKASYDVVAQRVVLTDNPVLRETGKMIRGAEKVIFDRKEGKFSTKDGRPELIILKVNNSDSALVDKLIGDPGGKGTDDRGGAGNR